jgi:hypothetical protein
MLVAAESFAKEGAPAADIPMAQASMNVDGLGMMNRKYT